MIPAFGYGLDAAAQELARAGLGQRVHEVDGCKIAFTRYRPGKDDSGILVKKLKGDKDARRVTAKNNGYDEFRPRETFVLLGKPGGTAFSDALSRIEIVHQLRGIQDGHPAGVGEKAVLSVPDGVAKVMAEHYLSVEGSSGDQPVLPVAGACPECGGELRYESGCVVCTAWGCGFSRCS
jgi:hypothetical protein